MPLQKAKNNSKKAINAAVSANIRELHANGTKPRSNRQIVAIAFSAAEKKSGKKKK